MWYCDKCNGIIENVEDGWVEWKMEGSVIENSSYGLRLVHHIKCAYSVMEEVGETSILNNHLRYFIGEQGDIKLSDMLQKKQFRDPDEVHKMIKKLKV